MGVYLKVYGYAFDGEGFTDGVSRMDFHPKPESSLKPLGHAEICKAVFERRGIQVEGPFED